VSRLRQLATASRHQVASGDAAITLSGTLADPVCDYDGIWVLGLAESRWPAPPRPDPYVPLREQREHHWPEAGVAERRAQALWALSRWQRRTRELVLSYPQTEGEIHHRPTALPGLPASAWEVGECAGTTSSAPGFSRPAQDQQFPALTLAELVRPLTGGERRLGVQQECPFRAQAQWRLAAHPPDPLSDGITALQRGNLLHALLQGLWGELQDQAHLLELTPQAERALAARHWNLVIDSGAISGARWWPAGLRQRERERTLDVVASILRLERARAPFAVQDRELKLQWPDHGARLNLRIDRIDRTADGSQLLIDYKSGAVGSVKLQDGELEPLQLALYVAALAARGLPVSAAALFSLKPGNEKLAGVSAGSTAPAGFKPVADWDALAGQWRQQLLQLLTDHLSGSGQLARSPDACRHCHLPALCRRAAMEDLEEAEDGDE
jgi:RecB family exonuclease